MGFGTIHLGPYMEEGGEFDASFVLNGQQAGWVKGTINIVWPDEEGKKPVRAQKSQGCACSIQ